MSPASAVLSSPSVERVRQALARAGLHADVSLVFRGEKSGTALLIMSSGARKVDTGALQEVAGEPVVKADAELVRRHTGFVIGGVAAGHGVSRVFVERTLARFDPLWAAAGHPHTVFRLSFAELLRLTNGIPATLAA